MLCRVRVLICNQHGRHNSVSYIRPDGLRPAWAGKGGSVTSSADLAVHAAVLGMGARRDPAEPVSASPLDGMLSISLPSCPAPPTCRGLAHLDLAEVLRLQEEPERHLLSPWEVPSGPSSSQARPCMLRHREHVLRHVLPLVLRWPSVGLPGWAWAPGVCRVLADVATRQPCETYRGISELANA